MTKPVSPILFPPRTSVHPGDDFYTHINGNWIRQARMPSFISSYSVSEEVEDDIADDLQREIRKSMNMVKANEPLSSEREIIGILALSCLQTSYQKNSLTLLKSLVNKLNCIRDINDVASTLGDYTRYRINTVISIFAGPESTNSNIIRTSIGAGSIGLPDVSYYRASAPGKMRTLLAYIKLLRTLGKDFDVPNLELLSSFESSCVDPLIKAAGDDELLMTGSEISSKYKTVPWDIFWQAALDLAPHEVKQKKFLVLSKSWLGYINKLFKTMTIDQWKVWFAGNLILHMLPILPPPYDDMYFDLLGKRLRGQSEKMPQKQLALFLCQQWLSVPLGKIYEDCCLDRNILRETKKLAHSIQDAAINRIQQVDWLDPKTRKKAVTKVKKVYFGIGIPEKWPKGFDGGGLVKDNLLQNILKLGEMRTLRDIELTKHSLDVKSWDDPVFAVNAYYYNEGNRLLIPAGILRKPFFDLEKSDGARLGGLGAVMGHELTHAFDVEGKDYDENGNAVSWWLPSDNRAYNTKSKALIKLFNSSKLKGHSVNGSLTLSENIADLGGLAIALEALNNILIRKRASLAEKKRQYREFFISYAVSWRIKEKKAASLQGLILDRHAPALLRVNLVVSQFQEWYDVFEVTDTNKLYIPPENRIQIF